MKTVFITGAAAGIGLAIAQRFAAEGWFVGIYDVNSGAIEQLLQSGEFSNACGGYCDVSNYDSVNKALQHFGEHEQTKGRATTNTRHFVGCLESVLNPVGIVPWGCNAICDGGCAGNEGHTFAFITRPNLRSIGLVAVNHCALRGCGKTPLASTGICMKRGCGKVASTGNGCGVLIDSACG